MLLSTIIAKCLGDYASISEQHSFVLFRQGESLRLPFPPLHDRSHHVVEFVKDHIIIWNGDNKSVEKSPQVVTN